MSNMAEMFDNDAAVIAAHDLARLMFEEFCAAEPDNSVGAAQLGLMRWQRDKFGDQPDERMALGIIEEMAETFDANAPTMTEEALDGLGDVCVYSSQLATNNRLAIAPILDLARSFTARTDIVPLRAAGVLAQVVLKGSQKIRGTADPVIYRRRLVAAMAMCIAKAIDDVEIIHEVSVKVAGVFTTIANEVMQRSAGHPGIPQQHPAAIVTSRTSTAERKAKATQALHEATAGADEFDVSDAGDKPVE